MGYNDYIRQATSSDDTTSQTDVQTTSSAANTEDLSFDTLAEQFMDTLNLCNKTLQESVARAKNVAEALKKLYELSFIGPAQDYNIEVDLSVDLKQLFMTAYATAINNKQYVGARNIKTAIILHLLGLCEAAVQLDEQALNVEYCQLHDNAKEDYTCKESETAGNESETDTEDNPAYTAYPSDLSNLSQRLYDLAYQLRYDLERLSARKVVNIPHMGPSVPAYLSEVKHDKLFFSTDVLIKELSQKHPQYSKEEIRLSCVYHLLGTIMSCLSNEPCL